MRYLGQLCRRSFLRLWSFPGLCIDKKPVGKMQGKELCDLLAYNIATCFEHKGQIRDSEKMEP